MAKQKKIATVLFLFIFLAAFIFAGAPSRRIGIKKDPSGRPSLITTYAEGEVLVKFKKGVSFAAVNQVATQNALTMKKHFRLLSKLQGNEYVLLRSSKKNTLDLLNDLNKNVSVEAVSLNYLREIDATPNDTRYSELWGMHNIGQTGGTTDADIDAPEAWDINTGSSGAIVAVIDTGLDYRHPDLAANVWVNALEQAGTAGVDDDGNGYVDDIYGIDPAGTDGASPDTDPMDGYGHGTHCSGTIGAVGNNSLGVVGVNWNVKIMGLKFFDDAGGNGYDSFSIECIEYAIDQKTNYAQNIVAINASWGGSGFDQLLKDAIDAAGTAGIVFCAAAGNGGSDDVGDNNDATPYYPASYTSANIIAVAATDDADLITGFSNYGLTSVDLGAPGAGILSTVPGRYIPQSGDIFFDSMEGGAGNWVHGGTLDTWALTTDQEDNVNPSFPVPSPPTFWSDNPGADYLPDTDSWLAYGVDIDLSSYAGQAVYLGIGSAMTIEGDGYDHGYVELSSDSGATWTPIFDFGGYSYYWSNWSWLIPESFKTSHFRFRFHITSDESYQYSGWLIDNVGIGTGTYGYESWNGTSMATPHVAGAVALMAAEYPAEGVATRIDRILANADANTSLTGKCVSGGRLNLYNSLMGTVPDTITVTSPNGGENWQQGTSHSITWNSTGSIANVKIEYSINNGSGWTTETASTADDGTYAWTVPAAPSTTCLVRVSDAANAATNDVSNATFTISTVVTPTVTVASPNGGENWTVGNSQNITWTSTGTIANVRIEYSTNSGSAWNDVIASTANDGSHAWTIPNAPSTTCLVRVSDAVTAATNDVSNATFTISTAVTPTVTVTSPNGGENWTVGNSQNVTWTSTGTIANVRIEYSTNNGSAWNDVIASTANDGSHAWIIPNAPSTTCLVRVSDAATAATNDVSNAAFTISVSGPASGWNTFLGSASADNGNGIAMDDSGNIFVVGSSTATWGTPLRAYQGAADAFVAKLDSSGALVWNTFLGSGSNDYGYRIGLDDSGNIYVAGNSETAWGSPVRAYQGASDAFVAKLSANGALQWNTFLGGTGNDDGLGIAVDGPGNVYVAGNSVAAWGSPVRSYTGGSDAFAAGLNTNGALQWNTFMGGTSSDYGYGIAVDNAGQVYLTGRSNAGWGSPVNDHYYSYDVFVAKIDSSANLLWNTFNDHLGFSDQGRAIAVDSSGYIYVAGSKSFTYTSAFVIKFAANGNYLSRTLLGDSLHTVYARGITADAHDNIFVTGQINYAWSDFSLTPLNPYSGGTDAFMAKLCPDLSLRWYTFLGSSGSDDGTDIAIDGSGNVAVTGSSDSSWSSPVNPHAGGSDAFAAKVADSQTKSLALVSPNGGENWTAGTTQNIDWTSTGTIDNVKIEYSTDNGGTWSAVIASTPDDGSYAWSVPNAPSAQCRIKISDAADSCTLDVSNSVFVIVPAITVTAPNGGESWTMGSTQNITWTSAGTIANVKIEYSTNNGGSWTTEAASTANSGNYAWLVPLTPGTQCLVRVSDAVNSSMYDVSDAVFTLTLAAITVVGPNGGEVWPTGSTQNIIWTWAGSIANVKIEYSTNNGGAWSLIETSTANDGIHSWLVPAISSDQCLIRVSDALNAVVSDSSDSVFSFSSSPTLVVNSPNGGEVWTVGSAHTIAWSSYGDAVGNVKIEYTTDNGAIWQTIISSTANDGVHDWTIPSLNSTQCKVRVSEASDGDPSDISNNSFTIRQANAPVGGHWSGLTNRNYPVSFDVSLDGGQWSNFILEAPVSTGISTIVTVPGPGNITNGNFTVSYAGGTFIAAGIFTSESGSTGTYNFNSYYLGPVIGYFSQSGTWGATASPLTLISPNGGEAWEPGSVQNITWTSLGTVGDIKIEYTANNGGSWQVIAASTANDGVHEWTVPAIISSECKVRVSEATDGLPVDESDDLFSILPAADLGEAVDNTSLKWFSGGSAPWLEETATYYFDNDAAQSGAIAYAQESFLQTTVTGPGTFSFYWKVSSAANLNYEYFYIDGALQDQISGEVNWVLKTYSIPAGTHILKWLYKKNSSTVSGSDCGWVDKVEFNPDLTISGTVFYNSSPLSGVVMNGLPGNPSTNVSGIYSGTVTSGWSGTVTPTFTGYTFSPANRVYANVIINQTEQNYTAAAIPATLALTAPNGGESWDVGEEHDITWTSTGTIANVNIDYSTNNGGNWTSVAGRHSQRRQLSLDRSRARRRRPAWCGSAMRLITIQSTAATRCSPF